MMQITLKYFLKSAYLKMLLKIIVFLQKFKMERLTLLLYINEKIPGIQNLIKALRRAH